MNLTDLQFAGFGWRISGNGDLALTDGLDSFRALVYRWLLTEPAVPNPAHTDEEVETRRAFATAAARASAYDPPAGERLTACLPWDPSWGAGIKRFLNLPITAPRLRELETRIRAGLTRLEGVTRVESLRLSATGSQITVAWRINTALGQIADQTLIGQEY